MILNRPNMFKGSPDYYYKYQSDNTIGCYLTNLMVAGSSLCLSWSLYHTNMIISSAFFSLFLSHILSCYHHIFISNRPAETKDIVWGSIMSTTLYYKVAVGMELLKFAPEVVYYFLFGLPIYLFPEFCDFSEMNPALFLFQILPGICYPYWSLITIELTNELWICVFPYMYPHAYEPGEQYQSCFPYYFNHNAVYHTIILLHHMCLWWVHPFSGS